MSFNLFPAVISGKVLDDEGDPVAHAQVQLQKWVYSASKRQLTGAGFASSDGSGSFRISGLAPGRYILCATPPPGSEDVRPAKDERLLMTYYAGSGDATSATSLEVTAGRDMAGTDIRLRKGHVYHVAGKVTGSLPLEDSRLLRITLLAEGSAVGISSASVGKDGSFELPGAPAGAFKLMLGFGQGQNRIVAQQSISIGAQDIDSYVFAVQPATDLHGRIRLDDIQKPATNEKPTNFSAVRVFTYSTDGLLSSIPNPPVHDDGSFVIPNLTPGKYRLSLYSIPDGTYPRSMQLDGKEVISGFDLNSASGAIEIALSPTAGQLDGTVQSDGQQQVQGTIVSLIADPFQEEKGYLYRMTISDQNGQFSFKNLIPGKYRLYAWEELEGGAQYNPDFLRAFEGRSVKVTVDANGRQVFTISRITSTDVTTRDVAK